MKNSTLAPILLLTVLCQATFGQSSVVFQHPKDQIAMQLGAIQMGYAVPFALVSKNATNAQQAANALAMGRYALDATVSKPAPKVQGVANSPAVDTVEFRDQLYQAVEAVITSPVTGSVRGIVTLQGGKKQSVSTFLTVPPNSHTIPVPFAVEASTSVDAQEIFKKLVGIGILPIFEKTVIVSTLAGRNYGFADGTAENAMFRYPSGIAVDGNGNLYIADSGNNRIRKLTIGGGVSTLAGGDYGFDDGIGENAKFAGPQGLAVDSSGNVYIADSGNCRIRKIASSGIVSTLAGFNYGSPDAVALGSNGDVYVADSYKNQILKISPVGDISVLAGSERYGFADGTAEDAIFARPMGMAVDGSGNVYVADSDNNRIRKITLGGIVSTFAGSGIDGFADGDRENARFNGPRGIAIDRSGYVYVVDSGNHRIRKISPSGTVSTLAGSGTAAFADGTGENARFASERGIAVDDNGNVYVADSNNHRIRKITHLK